MNHPPTPKSTPGSRLRRAVRWLPGLAGSLADVRRGEGRLVLPSAAYFFFILSAYYVIRPIRDDVSISGGIQNIPWLFTATLIGMLIAHPIFSAMVSRWPRKRFVTVTYRFFMLNLVVFYWLLTEVPDGRVHLWVERVFFVWTSVFNLFVVSIFWSFMTDLFRPGGGRRLFGLIAVGGTLGSVLGSSITSTLVGVLGPALLLLVSVLLLECAVQCLLALERRSPKPAAVSAPGETPGQIVGGNTLDGVRRVLTSPYLGGICAFMLLFTIGSTFLYNIQAEILSQFDEVHRTELFANIDLAVNTLTLATQVFLTGRLMRWLGVGTALSLLPLLSLAGFLALGAAPVLTVFVVFQVLRRAGNFAVTVPAREVLYTVLPRADKYKSKNFNDTFVYRAGDQVGAWTFAGIRVLGVSTAGAAWLMVPVAGIWLILARWLGRRQGELARAQEVAALGSKTSTLA